MTTSKPVYWNVSTERSRVKCGDTLLTPERNDTLDDLVLSYNNSKHQTIRMSSSDVMSDDELDLMRDMPNIPVPR